MCTVSSDYLVNWLFATIVLPIIGGGTGPPYNSPLDQHQCRSNYPPILYEIQFGCACMYKQVCYRLISTSLDQVQAFSCVYCRRQLKNIVIKLYLPSQYCYLSRFSLLSLAHYQLLHLHKGQLTIKIIPAKKQTKQKI